MYFIIVPFLYLIAEKYAIQFLFDAFPKDCTFWLKISDFNGNKEDKQEK